MYRKSAQGWSKHLDFIVLDIICLHVAFIISFIIRHGMRNPYGISVYRNIALVMTAIDILVVVFFGTMKNVLKRGYYIEFTVTVKHACLIELLIMAYLFIIQESEQYSRVTLITMGFVYFLLAYCMRIILKLYLVRRRNTIGKRSLLILTTDRIVNRVVEDIKTHNYEGFLLSGICVINRDMTGVKIHDVPVVANRENVVEYVCREWVDEVFINLPRTESYPEDLVEQFTRMGVVVHRKITKSSNLVGQKQFIERMGNYTVLTTSINYVSIRQIFFKRVLDILGGLAGCVITGILCVILGPIIYIQSPGPIFFTQTRVGKNGKKFKMYKFRSMYMDAEERKKELMAENRVKDGMMFKLDWDPRIIGSRQLPDGTVKKGIGNFMRDWSLDEFPQFINVLKGDMSLVGTRPPTVDEWEKYNLHHRARLATKPGVTGMWQVNGRSNITDFEEVVKLDTQYITEWNMGLDFRILLKTVGVVFKREGSM